MSYEHPAYEELAKDTLLHMMQDISEDCWCAGWLIDLEYTLWKTMNNEGGEYGWGSVEMRDRTRMKYLHALAGGWWVWDEGEHKERFVSTEEWMKTLARWKEKKLSEPL